MQASRLLELLRDRIRLLEWPGTSNKIFDNDVYIVVALPTQNIAQMNTPCAFIVDQGFVNDREYPRMGWQKFSIAFFLENELDSFGESTMIGSGQYANSSRGQGCKVVEETLLRELEDVVTLGSGSTPVFILPISLPSPQIVTGNETAIYKFLSYQAWCGLED